MTRQTTDAAALGLTVREFATTEAEQEDAYQYVRTLHTRMTRPAVSKNEWLTIYHCCRAFHTGAYLEIGVYRHASTCAFLRAMEANEATLTTVDVLYRHPEFAHPDPKVQNRWTKLTGSSLDIMPAMIAEGRTFDVIFVDGWHADVAVLNDTRHALQLLTPGGVAIMHDANSPPAMAKILEGIPGGADACDYYPDHPDHCKGLVVFPKGWIA